MLLQDCCFSFAELGLCVRASPNGLRHNMFFGVSCYNPGLAFANVIHKKCCGFADLIKTNLRLRRTWPQNMFSGFAGYRVEKCRSASPNILLPTFCFGIVDLGMFSSLSGYIPAPVFPIVIQTNVSASPIYIQKNLFRHSSFKKRNLRLRRTFHIISGHYSLGV